AVVLQCVILGGVLPHLSFLNVEEQAEYCDKNLAIYLRVGMPSVASLQYKKIYNINAKKFVKSNRLF
ncbi:hypothetical protein, partial [Glaesserella parasuis]|uniref:hypothetical protein n=1 Tax=Glaesserella parasuis TaxID=738 RepID=UPI000A5097AF